MNELLILADSLSKSSIVQGLAQQKYSKEDVFVLLMMGERLGIDPMAALTGIYLVKGRPYIGARLVRGLALKHGHTFEVQDWTAESCTVIAGRKGQEPRTFVYTIKEAAHAGLMNKETWRQHPRRMLLNAVTRHVMDACFADLFLGITVDDDSDPAPNPVRANQPSLPSAPQKPKLALSQIKEPQ